ncbi:MAG: 4-hydroxythreonine-4-phosphate dehydrogenase PdxA [Gammaproteobacteria bacterium]
MTAGDPAGIGPDLIVSIAQQSFQAELIAIGDPGLFEKRASMLKLPLKITEFDPDLPPYPSLTGDLRIIPLNIPVTAIPGKPDPDNAVYVLETLRIACHACLQGSSEAMVTAPVQKATINEAGFAFTGHTEYLADLCDQGYPVMMLVCPGLRIALVTTHLPLKQVCKAITKETLEKVLTVIDSDMRSRFGLPHPRILVCGLNPHAGENGYLGREEIDCIVPVINKLSERGMCLDGPISADTAFTGDNRDKTDVFVAMYHDQGLPVLKTLGFGESVNITLGLPVIRTSVDHGTALSLAGTGKANNNSMLAAIQYAIQMATYQSRPHALRTGMSDAVDC